MGVFSGPNVVEDSDYLYHVCTSSGTFVPNFSGTVEYLVVAGGGGGGMDMGGGGGGGGVLASTVSVTAGTSYTVTVGAGGTGAPAGNVGGNGNYHAFTVSATSGSNSVFGAVTATGGGFGGSSYFGYSPNNGYGANGGSGGGSSGYSDGSTGRGGSGTAGQGNAGGGSIGQYYSGGGGGAGAAGQQNPPHGGAGILNTILGLNYYWGAGGGGAAYSGGVGGNGGVGGGGGGASSGNGGVGLNNGQNAGPGGGGDWVGARGGDGGKNTGSGGGGGMHYNRNNQGGNGGSGIVVLRYLKSLGQSVFSGSPAYPLNSIVFSLDAANVGKGFAVECLVVAGGGGGGMDMGGGGGGGQAFQKSFSVTLGVSYPVTVGAGGAGSPGYYAGPPQSGGSGNPSSFGDIFLFGGGGGGSGHYFPYPYPSLSRQGQPGGGEDGGNAGGDSPCWGRNRGSGQTSSFGGYSGGSAGYNGDGSYTAGGGGGAAGHGEGGRGTWKGGQGGLGYYSAINGTGYYWGGGGGGSCYTTTAGAGGAGGGGGASAFTGGTAGAGGSGLNAGSAGTVGSSVNGGNAGANTGGGGGGATHAYSVGGNGGSGIVIIRYYGSQKATGGTITSSGGYTIHTFTSSGTFIPTDNIGAADMGQLNNLLTPVSITRNTTNGGGFVFDGTTSYIDVNSMDLITGLNPFTFDCFYTLSGSTAAELLGNYGSGYTSNNIWLSGRYGLYISGSVYFPGAPIANGTYHMACTRNSSGACVLYQNGVQVATGTLGGSIPANINFRIGCDVNGIAETLTGTIYSMKVYNRVLTAEEIFQNFCAQRGRFGI
jgi:hypothetical protein